MKQGIDWSAIASAVSALIALISVIYQIKTQKKLDDDKHNMARAIFITNGISSGGYELDISVANNGNTGVSNIDAYWKGNVNSENVNCKIEYSKGNDYRNYEFKIITNWEKNKVKENIEGDIVISYTNIYGKKQNCKYPVKIKRSDENYSLDKAANNEVVVGLKGGYFIEC